MTSSCTLDESRSSYVARRFLNPPTTKGQGIRNPPRYQTYKRSESFDPLKPRRSEKLTAWLAPQSLRQRPQKAWQTPSTSQMKRPRRLVLRSNLWRTWNIADFPEEEMWLESESERIRREAIAVPLVELDG